MLGGVLETITNLETFELDLEFVDDETGAPWFLQSLPPLDITFKLRDIKTQTEVLAGSLIAGELVVTGDGTVRVTFSAARVGVLQANKSYEAGGLYKADANSTKQYFLGTLPVLEGLG